MKLNIRQTLSLIEECVQQNKLQFLAELVTKLEQEYIELARLITNDNYTSEWTHKQVLDYFTYE